MYLAHYRHSHAPVTYMSTPLIYIYILIRIKYGCAWHTTATHRVGRRLAGHEEQVAELLVSNTSATRKKHTRITLETHVALHENLVAELLVEERVARWQHSSNTAATREQHRTSNTLPRLQRDLLTVATQ